MWLAFGSLCSISIRNTLTTPHLGMIRQWAVILITSIVSSNSNHSTITTITTTEAMSMKSIIKFTDLPKKSFTDVSLQSRQNNRKVNSSKVPKMLTRRSTDSSRSWKRR